MSRITDVRPQANGQRVYIRLDGDHLLGVDRSVFEASGLQVGDEVDADALEELLGEKEKQSAFERAVHYATYRPRTERELRDFLRNKGYTNEAIRAALDKLTEYGYCDDLGFCREYVATYGKHHGIRKMRYGMRKLGADSEAIETALAEMGNQHDTACKMLTQYIRRTGETAKGKLREYLFSRGFESDDISWAIARCIERHLAEDDGGDDVDDGSDDDFS